MELHTITLVIRNGSPPRKTHRQNPQFACGITNIAVLRPHTLALQGDAGLHTAASRSFSRKSALGKRPHDTPSPSVSWSSTKSHSLSVMAHPLERHTARTPTDNYVWGITKTAVLRPNTLAPQGDTCLHTAASHSISGKSALGKRPDDTQSPSVSWSSTQHHARYP